MTVDAYPLHWPPGKPRTANPQPSRFGTNSWSGSKRISLDRATQFLLEELDRLGAVDEVLSSNLRLRRDGLPISNQRVPDDPGIAVYFQLYNPDTLKYDDVCLACDRWDKQACNVWSIAKSIEALCGLDRWGGGDMVRAAFTGFVTLPAPSAKPWWAVLAYYGEDNCLENDFETGAREPMHEAHPDRGGDAWQFDQIVKARQAARDTDRQNK